jgi:hypothetical protein
VCENADKKRYGRVAPLAAIRGQNGDFQGRQMAVAVLPS